MTDNDSPNKYVLDNSSTDILQTTWWAEAKAQEGWRAKQLFVSSETSGLYLFANILFKQVSKLGQLGYIPHGPVFGREVEGKFVKVGVEELEENKKLKLEVRELWSLFEDELDDFAEQNHLFAVEFEPKLTQDQFKIWQKLFGQKNWKITGRNRQPIYKLTIDLQKLEDEILAGMKKSTRYNIRYAAKNNVVVKSYDLTDPAIGQVLDSFYNLLEETQKRAKGYPIRSRAYFENFINVFKNSGRIKFFVAEYNGSPLAINISEFTNVWASSFYAASSRDHSNLKAPYLLRWAAILEAKARGCKIYDFWGIIPKSKAHKGYSDHKLSFGGEREDFVGLISRKYSYKAIIYNFITNWRAILAKIRYR